MHTFILLENIVSIKIEQESVFYVKQVSVVLKLIEADT
ncbi:hypothetical protein EfmE980_1340 [Enterococcus faecium E980]|nr:hypothetical protein EfmE980_1340 [Enterococcus faecium E980]MBL4991655.1 hypothetical protein [Enterococcus lactis]MBL4993605.1 hypothetical protein [Enterococcus lactis]